MLRQDRKRVLLLSAVAVILALFTMPSGTTSHYEYAEGHPWMYNALIAPYSFPIEKSEELLETEEDSLRKSFIPYFNASEAKREAAIEQLIRLYGDTLSRTVTRQTLNRLRSRLDDIYAAGIISSDEEDILNGISSGYIKSCTGNVSRLQKTDAIHTPKSAYSFLMDTEMDDFERNALSEFHLEELILPNLSYDSIRSQADLMAQEDEIPHYSGMVVANQKIVDRGEIIDSETYQMIVSYMDMEAQGKDARQFDLLSIAGNFLYLTILFVLLSFYLLQYRKDIIENKASVMFLYSLTIIFIVATNLYLKFNVWSIFIIPCVMLPIMLRIFLDSRTAFVGFIVYLLACSMSTMIPYEFVILQIVAGLTSIYSFRELTQRSQIFSTVFLVLAAYFLVWFALQMMQLDDIHNIPWLKLAYMTINCILLLLTYPLILAVEKIFGFTSNVTLIELSNINHPLLRQLAENAPGTFQHSMQVSTLAAEAAHAVGASTQLVRTAALYHDIGKTCNPPFFTENQNGVNPHDGLSCIESSRIITQHVGEGLKLAEKYHIPQAVTHCIRTHHGTGLTKYFYIKYCNEHPNEDVDKSLFRYEGPDPDTKETAILMMADAVEASSRSLQQYTEEKIGNLVDSIIDTQINEGFFYNCPMTFREFTVIKEVFKEKLKTMYHTRISYPTLNGK